jgi:Ca2+-transporting ATPase
MDGTATGKLNPFIISGNKIFEGMGTFLIISVGENLNFGKILRSLQVDSENISFQVKLLGLADWIKRLSSA